MKHFYATLFFLAAVAWTNPATAQIPTEVMDAARERVQGMDGTSMVIGIVNGDKVSYEFINGSQRTSATKETIFEIGSITKAFTGILTAMAALTKEIDIRKPVADYLPKGTVIPEKNGRKITVQDLLTHRSGLISFPDGYTPPDPLNPYAHYTREQVFQYLSTYSLTREPGVQYEYSNLGMGLVGLMLEHLKTKTYSEIVSERICAPLGMKSTFIDVPAPMRPLIATPYAATTQVSGWDIPALAAAGALKSSAADMTLFLKACLGVTDTPLKAALARAEAPLEKTDMQSVSVGYGWHIRHSKNADIVWHNGGTGGYKSFTGYIKQKNLGVVILVNNSTVEPTYVGVKILDEASSVARFPKTIEVTNEYLQGLTGTFTLVPGFALTITADGTRLFAQATGQDKFEIYPEKKDVFYYKVVEATVEFTRDKDGIVDRLKLKQNGQTLEGKKN